VENKLQNKEYNEFYLYLSLAVPFLLITGPFLPDLVISVFSLIFIFKIFQFKNYRQFFFTEKKIFFFVLLFFIYINLISIFSIDKYLSFKNTIPFFRFFLFSVFLYFIILKKKNFFNKISLFFLFILFLFLSDILIEIIFGTGISGLIGETNNNSRRFSSFFGDEEIMGSYISRLLPLFISCLIISDVKNKNQIFLLTFILSFILILASGERVALIFYLITFIHLIFIKKFKYVFLIFLSIFVIIIFSLNQFNFKPAKRIIDATVQQLKPSVKFANVKEQNIIKRERNFFIFSERHENHFFQAYEIFKKNILFGTGPNTFRIACKKEEFSNETRLKINNESYAYAQEDLLVSSSVTTAPLFLNEYNKERYNLHLINYIISDASGNIIIPVNEDETYRYKLLKKINSAVLKGDAIIQLTLFYPDGCNTHPHNIPMQFLSDLGLIGILFLLIFYIFFAREYFKTIFSLNYSDLLNSHKFAYLFIILSFIINLFPLLPNGNFFNNWISILFYYPLGIMLFLRKKIYYE